MVHLVRDITERKKADKALAESDEGAEGIFEKLPTEYSSSTWMRKRFYGCNPTICQMLGYTPEEIVTLGITDIHPAKDLPYVMDQFQRQAEKSARWPKTFLSRGRTAPSSMRMSMGFQ